MPTPAPIASPGCRASDELSLRMCWASSGRQGTKARGHCRTGTQAVAEPHGAGADGGQNVNVRKGSFSVGHAPGHGLQPPGGSLRS